MYDTAQTTDEQEEANDLYTAQKNRWEYSRQTGVQYQDKNSNQHYKYSENKHYSGKIKQKVRAVDPTKGNDCRIWKRGFEESKTDYESATAAGIAIDLSASTVYRIINNGTHKTWCGEYFVKVKVVNQSSSSSSSSTSTSSSSLSSFTASSSTFKLSFACITPGDDMTMPRGKKRKRNYNRSSSSTTLISSRKDEQERKPPRPKSARDLFQSKKTNLEGRAGTRAEWKLMDENSKNPYKKLQKKDLERYKKAMQVWNAKKSQTDGEQNATTSSSSSSSSSSSNATTSSSSSSSSSTSKRSRTDDGQ